MSTQAVKVRAREEVARGTLALHLEKPPGFRFKAGQAVDVILGGGEAHAFSLVSAPFEDELVVATRLRDTAYKRALAALAVGDAVSLDGPFGSLTLHKDTARAAIFVAGGIGITPFMSILRHAAHDDRPRVITLLYSNRRPEDAPFLQELQRLDEVHRGWFRLIATMTEPADGGQDWNGLTGTIGPDLIRSVIVRPAAPVFYVAGPPAMVAGMRRTLNGLGINDDDIRSEDFSGY